MANTDSKTPAVQAHVLYDNEVIETKIEELLESNVDVRILMTIDNSLVGVAGDKKTVNTYDYTGTIEKLGRGEGNTVSGKVSYTSESKEIELFQSNFSYYDEDVRRDPMVVEVGLKGIKADFINDLQDKFYAEVAKATNEVELESATAAFTYDDVVDAIAEMEGVNDLAGVTVENENGLFILAGKEFKKDIRKDDAFKAAEQGQMLFSGNFGSVAGLPIIYSNKIGDKEAYVMTKEAVKMLVKKELEVEQERSANYRRNDIYMRNIHLVYLADNTKIVKISKPEE